MFSSVALHVIFETEFFNRSQKTPSLARLADQCAPGVLLSLPPQLTEYKRGTSKLCELGVELDEGAAGPQDRYKIKAWNVKRYTHCPYKVGTEMGQQEIFIFQGSVCAVLYRI